MPIYAVSVVLAVMSASAGVLIDNVSQLLSVVRYAYTPIKMCFSSQAYRRRHVIQTLG